jgi:hypothetical protein
MALLQEPVEPIVDPVSSATMALAIFGINQ